MTPSQKKAVQRHRKRQARKGIVRVEVNVPESDRELVRELAASLRSGGAAAEELRTALKAVINPYAGMTLKKLIEAMPEGELDIRRSRDPGREIEF